MMSETTTTTQLPPPSTTTMTSSLSDEDTYLSNSQLLSQQEVIKRRSNKLKKLSKVYKHHYWCMMEELKFKYRNYYWEYGKSPYYQLDNNTNESVVGGSSKNDGEFVVSDDLSRCAVHGCKMKAMALTKFCHGHILSDSKQKLYMGCSYVIKSSQAGPIICGKPILKCTVPRLCAPHFQKAEKHVARALKKAGLNGSSTNKLAPKFHVIIAEYVRQIQSIRRVIAKEHKENLEIKEEDISI
nr:INO80 complex subunit D-like [Tanacetum cinerariifolium]